MQSKMIFSEIKIVRLKDLLGIDSIHPIASILVGFDILY